VNDFNKYYSDKSEFIKVLFELCQKKILQIFFIADSNVRKILNKMDFSDLAENNRQDLIMMGHILCNMLVYKNIGKEKVQEFISVVKADRKSIEIWSDEEEKDFVSQD